jgi:hypothetical protein
MLYRTQCNVLVGMHIGIFIAMSFFNFWQWYLCLSGVPQIEFMQLNFDDNSGSNYGYG